MKTQGTTPGKRGSKKLLLLKRKMDSSDSGNQTTNPSSDLKSWSIYTSAKELPFNIFQTICIEEKLELLIKDGNPPVSELINAWLNIYTEYSDALDSRYSATMEESMDTEVLRTKTMLVHNIIQILSKKHYPELIDILRQHGYPFKFDCNNPEEYHRDISRVVTRSKFWVLKLQQKDAENKLYTKTAKPTYEHFAECLFALSMYAGYEIRAYDITAFEFATRYKAMMAYYNMKRKPQIDD